jgi:hypothetical protein
METGIAPWSSASFRISSSGSNAQLIEEALSVLGAGRFKKVAPGKETAKATQVADCLWVSKSGLSPSSSLQEHVDALLSFVDSNAETLLGLTDKCSFDFFCGFSSGAGQGGLGISFSSLSRMGQLHIDLILDLYPPTEEGLVEPES